jgi:outer membrane protein OmpA-like peptidoglycan-associated protein
MKAIKFTSLLVIALALTIGATGCKRKPVGMTPISGKGYRPGDAPPTDLTSNRIGSDTTSDPLNNPLNPDLAGDLSNFNQDRSTLAAHTVQFEYDSSEVRSSERGKVEAVAAYMKSAPAGVALLIEGHCDERGTEEYNRALGERRALAVREALVTDGVDGMKVTTRSFGKDRPVDTSNTEAGMSKNRRGEFVVLHPK